MSCGALSIRSLVVLALALTAGVGAAAAPARSAPAVVILRPAGQQALAARLCAEMALRKIRCREIARSPTTATIPRVASRAGSHATALRAALEQSRAAAAVTITSTAPPQLLVWRRGHTRPSRTILEPAPGARGLEALRTAEVLRALLGERDPPAATEREVSRSASAVRRRFALQLEAGATWATPDLRSPLQLGLRFGWALGPRLGLEAWVLIPTLSDRVEGKEGVGHLFFGLAAAKGCLNVVRSRWIDASVGLGLGVLVAHVRGEQAAGFAGARQWGASAIGLASAGLAVPLTARLSAVADAMVGGSFSRLVVAFGEREAAVGGHPLITLTAGTRYTW